MIDANNLSSRAAFFQKTYGINVYKISEIGDITDAIIFIFGFHSDEIAADMDACGLAEGQNYIKTGLR